MQSRTVQTVTNNEDYVRLRIFDGDLPLSESGHELVRLYREQSHHMTVRLADANAELSKLRATKCAPTT